jgi:hypothetical protein
MGLNRFNEAQDLIKQGMDLGLDTSSFHNRLYLIAILKGDEQEARRHADWFAGKSDEYQMREVQARTLAFFGRRREASDAFEKAAEMAQQRDLPAERIRILTNQANMNALFGETKLAKNQMARVLSLLETEKVTPEEMVPSLMQQLDSPGVGWTLALNNDSTRAVSIADGILKRVPLETMQHSVWVPLIRATLELNRGSAEGGEKAIQLLQASRQYEAATFFKPEWVRAQAYLNSNDGQRAAAEFQKIIDHRGWDTLSPLWPLAHLGLARSYAMQDEKVKSKQAYEDFFKLWKNADSDSILLRVAKREYARLIEAKL